MASFPQIPSLLPFDPDEQPSSLGQRWRKWISRFENYLLATNIRDNTRKRALLLHCAGGRVQDIFDTFRDVGEARDYDLAVQRLTNYFTPQRNIHYERFLFGQARQEHNESVDDYHVRLRRLAATCEYPDEDNHIMSHMIQTCTDQKLLEKYLREPQLTLEALLHIARTSKLIEHQTSHMRIHHQPHHEVQAIWHQRDDQIHRQRSTHDNNQPTSGPPNSSQRCGNCGTSHDQSSARWSTCPAYGRTCFNCGKRNHFSPVCRSSALKVNTENHRSHYNETNQPQRQVNQLQEDKHHPQPENTVIFSINETGKLDLPEANIQVKNAEIQFILDSGASVNLIDTCSLKKFANTHILQPTTTMIYPYGSQEPLHLLGSIEVQLSYKEKTLWTTLYVLHPSILGRPILSYKSMISQGFLQNNRTMMSTTNQYETTERSPQKTALTRLKLQTLRPIPTQKKETKGLPDMEMFHQQFKEDRETEISYLLSERNSEINLMKTELKHTKHYMDEQKELITRNHKEMERMQEDQKILATALKLYKRRTIQKIR